MTIRVTYSTAQGTWSEVYEHAELLTTGVRRGTQLAASEADLAIALVAADTFGIKTADGKVVIYRPGMYPCRVELGPE